MSETMRIIDTDRLRLEPQRVLHAEAMFAVLCDPAIYIHENAPPPSLQWLRERFARLETRRSGDGTEQWLNWVARLRGGPLIGYVQATVKVDGQALIAYELTSAHWHRGLGSEAVSAMIAELSARYSVHSLWAVFKRSNLRSQRLLAGLGFTAASADDCRRATIDADEDLMQRRAATTTAHALP